eukprot:759603-Hanusia_phi.AAC.2
MAGHTTDRSLAGISAPGRAAARADGPGPAARVTHGHRVTGSSTGPVRQSGRTRRTAVRSRRAPSHCHCDNS